VNTETSPWRRSWRADPAARALADRHYNRQKSGAPQFVPPGRCLVMLTGDRSALWVTSWPYGRYVMHGWAGAWVCSTFRNEGGGLSSALITRAVAHSRAYWPAVPAEGIVTFIDPGKTRPKDVPGWCFLRAGWSHVGFTQGGLWVYQQLPGRRIGRRGKPMPPAEPVPGMQLSLLDGAA
jgi:hypothetical protein